MVGMTIEFDQTENRMIENLKHGYKEDSKIRAVRKAIRELTQIKKEKEETGG